MTDNSEIRLAKINADLARIRKLLHDSICKWNTITDRWLRLNSDCQTGETHHAQILLRTCRPTVRSIEADQLKQLAAQGQIAPDDHVWREGDTTRFLARDVKGLFAAAPPPPPIKSPLPEAIHAAPCISCPSCHNLIADDGSLAGRMVRCPHCSTKVRMPEERHIVPPPMVNHLAPSVGEIRPNTTSPKPNPLVAVMVPAGLVVAVVGAFCPWYSAASSSNTAFGGGASFAASLPGWWTIPGILTGLVSVPGFALGMATVFSRSKVLPVLASICGLLVVLLGIWGMFYAPSATSSVDLGAYGSGHAHAGFEWGIFVTMTGGAIAAIAAIASLLFQGSSQRVNLKSTVSIHLRGRSAKTTG